MAASEVRSVAAVLPVVMTVDLADGNVSHEDRVVESPARFDGTGRTRLARARVLAAWCLCPHGHRWPERETEPFVWEGGVPRVN